MDEQRAPRLWWGMWKRFIVGGLLIAAISGGATTVVALNKVTDLAEEVFPKMNHIDTPKGLITPEYGGGPQTFLILGSDRRSGSHNAEERDATPRSDTILLVRFDPSQKQTSVLSIPRDLLVNIRLPNGQVYANEKINAAYSIGSKLHGVDGGIVLAAETIEREVFPGLEHHLNGIVDVNFAGFIKVVDTLGCAYVQVDHRYIGGGALGESFSAINLQPGYQKLCYERALSYVRYRHDDSDLVRVARQQDFIRELRQQINPERQLHQIDRVAKAVGHAIRTNLPDSASELILLGKLIAFSQTKPLRQVKFQYTSQDANIGGGSYVTSTPELERETLNKFLNGSEQLELPSEASSSHASSSHSSKHSHHKPQHHLTGEAAARAIDLYPTSSTGESEVVKIATEVPFRVLYPTLQTGVATQETVRRYDLRDESKRLHHAYVVVWRENMVGQYYNFEATDWTNPPLFAHAHSATIGGRTYQFVDDGSHIHVIGWRSHGVLYYVTNTLLEELSNSQMIAIAKSAQPLK
jgi:polyisoprenyl-teichoic acid--peptidoglycan teichoic acid transferase